MQSIMVRMPNGEPFVVNQLLTRGRDNAKFAKTSRAELGWEVMGLALAPAMESGYQTCPKSTPGCRASCIYTSGNAVPFPNVKRARVAKTIAFFEQRELFMEKLIDEVDLWYRHFKKKRLKLAIRLNVFSDIGWENYFPFHDFPKVQFFDYTKIHKRVAACLSNRRPRAFPPNYSLCFSRSERNDEDCVRVLEMGGNVAVPFFGPLPEFWGRFEVVNGDTHDLTFLRPPGTIIGLSGKGQGKKDQTGFIVRIPLTMV